jgi:hypothetical protein
VSEVLIRSSEFATLTLDELADGARREEEQAIQDGLSAIRHFIRAGAFLLEARSRFAHGEWIPWLEQNWDSSITLAQVYMRLARNRELLALEQPRTLSEAQRLISGFTRPQLDPRMVERIRELREAGMSFRDIGESVGMHRDTVRRYADPKVMERDRQRAKRKTKAYHRAVAQERRERDVREAGGEIAKAYALVRKALQACELASGEDQSRERRQAIRSAMASLYGAEDQLVAASRIARGE